MPRPIYLDYAATTPVDPLVIERMQGCLGLDGHFGNPASRSHVYGWQAEQQVEGARRQVADLIGADPRGIVWTSGATEADNLAIKGVAEARAEEGLSHIVTSALEHKAVLDACAHLEGRGFTVTYLLPDAHGVIGADQVAEALTPRTLLVSLMHVNNETGVITDIEAVGERVREHGAVFHVDAAQSVGKLAIDVQRLPVDLMSLSAHKVYGPKGVGALYVRRRPRVPMSAQIHGGGHERGLRSGTLPTHQIVGMGEAFRLAAEAMDEEPARIQALRERLEAGVCALAGVRVNGHPERRACAIANIRFEGVDGDALLASLKDLAVSTGSACNSETLEASYVLRAMGLSDASARSALRFSLGRFTDEAALERAIEQVSGAVQALRAPDSSASGS